MIILSLYQFNYVIFLKFYSVNMCVQLPYVMTSYLLTYCNIFHRLYASMVFPATIFLFP